MVTSTDDTSRPKAGTRRLLNWAKRFGNSPSRAAAADTWHGISDQPLIAPRQDTAAPMPTTV